MALLGPEAFNEFIGGAYPRLAEREPEVPFAWPSPEPQEIGSPQLYIHGPTGVGKTHLISQLRTYFRVYDVCMTEKWMDNYDDDLYDLVIMEEFTGHARTLSEMNQFLDGQVVALPRRNKPSYLKQKNIPVIVLSNLSLEKAYKNCNEEQLAPLMRRFLVVNVGTDHTREKPINLLTDET